MVVLLRWLSSCMRRKKAKKASKQRPRRERGGGGEGPNVFQFLTTCMVQATTKDDGGSGGGNGRGDSGGGMVWWWPTLLLCFLPFATFFVLQKARSWRPWRPRLSWLPLAAKHFRWQKRPKAAHPALLLYSTVAWWSVAISCPFFYFSLWPEGCWQRQWRLRRSVAGWQYLLISCKRFLLPLER